MQKGKKTKFEIRNLSSALLLQRCYTRCIMGVDVYRIISEIINTIWYHQIQEWYLKSFLH